MERDWMQPVTAVSANAVLRHTETLPNLKRSASDTSLIGVKSGHSRLVLHWLRMLIKFAFVSSTNYVMWLKKQKNLQCFFFTIERQLSKSISCQLPKCYHTLQKLISMRKWQNLQVVTKVAFETRDNTRCNGNASDQWLTTCAIGSPKNAS